MINIESFHVSLPNSTFNTIQKERGWDMAKTMKGRSLWKKNSQNLHNYPQLISIMMKKSNQFKSISPSEGDEKERTNATWSYHLRKNKNKELLQQSELLIKSSELLTQALSTHKSCSTNTRQKSKSKKKWKQTILRRKNNGSQGKIITGLTQKQHIEALQKVRAKELNRKRIQAEWQQENYALEKEQFEPIGTAIQLKDERKGRGQESFGINNLKTTIKKKLKMESKQSKNIRMVKTQPDIVYQTKKYLPRNRTRNQIKTHQKGLVSSQHVCKRLCPWNDNSTAL